MKGIAVREEVILSLGMVNLVGIKVCAAVDAYVVVAKGPSIHQMLLERFFDSIGEVV